jgi:hypothetical protein
MNHPDDLNADELQSVVARLRADRPEATALELDAVKQRVRGRMSRPAGRRARSANLMKSRLAILSMLVAGMLMSTTGAGLAVSGISGGDNASVEQYTNDNDKGDVLGEDDASQPSGTAGEEAGQDVQPTRQVESGAGSAELPFTGFLAIPVLLGGLALLSVGLVLRRRASDDHS